MRKLSLLIFGFSGLICVGFAAFIYQLWAMFTLHNDDSVLYQNQGAVFIPATKTTNHISENPNSTATKPPLMIDYSILPDYSHTARTKQFLESVYTKGYIGTHDNFQKILTDLKTDQIVSNMMLRKDEIAYLKTVNISSNMLSMTQIQKCKTLAQQLLLDIKSMSSSCTCSHEQKAVLNMTLSRLLYLNTLYEHELNKFNLVDPFYLKAKDPMSQGMPPSLDLLQSSILVEQAPEQVVSNSTVQKNEPAQAQSDETQSRQKSMAKL